MVEELTRPRHALTLNGTRSLTQARRIRQAQGVTIQLEDLFNHIPRCARLVAHDGAGSPEKEVEQRGFSDVGLPGNNHTRPVAEETPLVPRGEKAFGAGSQGVETLREAWEEIRGKLVFLKIKGVLHLGGAGESLVVKGRERLTKATFQVGAGGFLGARRPGGDEVGNCFRLREVEASIQEGALRELARLGRASTKLQETLQHGLRDSLPAMHAQLNHVLAGITMRGAVEEENGVIQRFPAPVQHLGVGKRSGGSCARRRRKARKLIGDSVDARTAQPDDCHPAETGRRGECRDRLLARGLRCGELS